MILREWLDNAVRRLTAAQIESASLEAQLIAGHVLLRDRTWVVAHPEAELNELAAESLLQRRENREPLAYLLGWREFYGRRFNVRPGVLIPRHESETLVDAALGIAQAGPVLDLGTGSGCLAISIKLERPELEVWASDISEAALEIARSNAEELGAEVHFLRSDGFENLEGRQFELIVSNPPYIADSEQLMPEVSEHEPTTALYSGPTGLEFYLRLAKEAGEHLLPKGKLAVEVGHTQARAVAEIISMQGWINDSVLSDLAGIERVVVSSRPAII